MKLHPRALHVQQAEVDIDAAVGRLVWTYDLTNTEACRALVVVLDRYLRLMLRMERHPDDPDQNADEE